MITNITIQQPDTTSLAVPPGDLCPNYPYYSCNGNYWFCSKGDMESSRYPINNVHDRTPCTLTSPPINSSCDFLMPDLLPIYPTSLYSSFDHYLSMYSQLIFSSPESEFYTSVNSFPLLHSTPPSTSSSYNNIYYLSTPSPTQTTADMLTSSFDFSQTADAADIASEHTELTGFLDSSLTTDTLTFLQTAHTIVNSPIPTPTVCTGIGIWPDTSVGHNVTGTCYKGTVNGKFLFVSLSPLYYISYKIL